MKIALPFKLPVSVLDVSPHAALIQDADLKDVLMVCRGWQSKDAETIAHFVASAMNRNA